MLQWGAASCLADALKPSKSPHRWLLPFYLLLFTSCSARKRGIAFRNRFHFWMWNREIFPSSKSQWKGTTTLWDALLFSALTPWEAGSPLSSWAVGWGISSATSLAASGLKCWCCRNPARGYALQWQHQNFLKSASFHGQGLNLNSHEREVLG